MIKFNNFPPRSGEDIAFTSYSNLIIESLSAENEDLEAVARDRATLFKLGEGIGRVLCANVVWEDYKTPQEMGDTLRSMARSLTSHWEGDDFDEQFHRGYNQGIHKEYVCRYNDECPVGEELEFDSEMNYI